MTTRDWTLMVWAALAVAFAALVVISHLSEGRLPTLSSTILSAHRPTGWPGAATGGLDVARLARFRPLGGRI